MEILSTINGSIPFICTTFHGWVISGFEWEMVYQKWGIIKHFATSTNSRKCHLCLEEKLYIPITLDTSEIFCMN